MSVPELSCGLPPGPGFADLTVLAEELGYARAWIYDSAPLWEDPFVHLALAARRTTRIGLATAVLVPDERSEMAMASGLVTLARLAPGRLRACFGTGFTARLALGQSPMRLDDFAAYVRSVRGLLAGDTVLLDGEHSPLDLIIARTAIEPVCAEQAALSRHPADLAVLEEAYEEQARATEADEGVTEADLAFHLAVAAASRNGVLIALERSLIDLMHEQTWSELHVQSRSREHAASRYLEHHRLVLQAIADRDARRARQVMAMHMCAVETVLLSELRHRDDSGPDADRTADPNPGAGPEPAA